MYATDLFSDGRFLHIGIDIGAPVGTPCMAFDDGDSHFGYNPADGDYGYVIITNILSRTYHLGTLWTLKRDSIKDKQVVRKSLEAKSLAGWGISMRMRLGAPPTFQLSLDEPETHDMPRGES